MDELKNFFENPQPSSAQIVKLKAPLTDGFRITKDNPLDQLNRREDHRHSMFLSGTDYAREVKQRETELYVKSELEHEKYPNNSIAGGLESLEQLSSFGTSVPNIQELTEEAMNEVYNKYSFQMKEEDKKLPISDYRQEVLDRINNYHVVIIQGPTGCGKTTQVPQWILDDCYLRRRPCKIVVTQPRRIAAISIAKRVAQERGWDVGGIVGYQVGLSNVTTTDTRISYVTTGVLLQKLVNSKTMNEYTHIILDEVHERGQEMDFLLLVVRKFLHTVSHMVKVVLMSATFDSETFSDYFKTPTPTGQTKSIVFQIQKKENFSVKNFYLNNLTKFVETKVFDNQMARANGEPCITPEMNHLVVKLINAFELIDTKEDHIEDRDTTDLPSVLVFLPGINEIEDLFICLTDRKTREKLVDSECARYNWWVLPLHSTITADEQVRVFQRAPQGHRKIILATNIAESSITVPDIKYVIDYCMMKMLVADQSTNFTSLQLHWASKTNCEQRAGRAGRVRDGRVYRLVSESVYETFKEECPPEIRRCPLERLSLLAKMLDMGPPKDILALAMDPPDISNIFRTILVLKELGALRKTLLGEWSDEDGDLTYLGRIMAKLPLDVRASKLILLGHIYGCLEECVIMAAAMSVKNVFSSPFRERLNAYNSKLTWADGSTSDCIALYNVYKVWTMLRQRQYYKHQGNTEAQWARRFYVQLRALKELDDLVRELKMRLSREGIEVQKGYSLWDKNENAVMLKIIMAGAVYPQYFVQMSQDEERERYAVRTLGGLDPRNTVYLKDFPDNQPGPLYAAAIKKAIRQQINDEPRVTFDKNSQKVYLTFEDNTAKRHASTDNDPTIPGQVVLPVYKAIKARQVKMDIRLSLLPQDKANELAAALEMDKLDINMSKFVPRLPDIDDTHFPLKISERINVGKFWVQYDDDSTASELRQIQKALNTIPLLAYTGPVKPGLLAAGPYLDTQGTTMHRVRVLKVLGRDMVEVIFIDYGNMAQLKTCNLHELPRGMCTDIPPLAMQCTLAGIAPSPLLNQHAQWSKPAWALFNELVNIGRLLGKVFSVTHGVVSIELLADNGHININERLLKNGFAVPCEESYDSKMNHDLRQTANELNMSQKRAFNREQQEMAFYTLREVESPNVMDCVADAHLKGPFSPLETTVHSLMYASRERSVVIEWNSVNSVLLDTEPQETYQRMLVAADVGQNEASSKLTLRHTTLMPNIPGLPAIIALIFCPTAELRRDSEGTRYVSALCGLGSNENGSPYFPEHDLLVNIDADLAVNEIGEINHIRYLMDFSMSGREQQDVSTAIDESYTEATGMLRKGIIELLRKKRTHREPQAVAKAWEWKSVPEHELLDINVPEMVEAAVIYPLHTPQELRPMDREKMLQLKRENEELKLHVGSSAISAAAELTCKLCSVGPMPTHAMRIHLYSNAHRDKEADFRMFES